MVPTVMALGVCSAIQCSPVQFSAVQYSINQYSTAQDRAVQFNAIQDSSKLAAPGTLLLGIDMRQISVDSR